MHDSYAVTGWLRVAFWICVVIAVAAVLRRVSALAAPPQSVPPQLAGLDGAFAAHTQLTLLHIIPALGFVIIAPLVILRAPEKVGRWGRLLYPLGAIVGLTAYAMSAYPIGGWLERSAVLFFNSLFLYSLLRAFNFWRQGAPNLERRWLVRAIVILLGIATTRPVMGVFFATSRLTHLTPHDFFGIAFWIGFSINTVGVELWLRSGKRPHSPSSPVLPSAQ